MPLVELPKIANILVLSQRRINQLVKTKRFPRAKRGLYDLIKCVRWYVVDQRRQIKVARKGGDRMVEAEIRIKEARAQVAELELGQKRNELAHIDDFLRELEPGLAAIRSILLGIPKHAARELNNKDIEAYLENFIRQSLEQLATIPNRFQRFAAHPNDRHSAGIQRVQAAAKIERKRVGRSKSRTKRRSQRRKRKMEYKQSRI